MNEEKKAIAEDIFYMFDQGHITPVEALTAMEALLQELIDEPQAQAVQSDQSEQHLEMVNAPAPSVPDGLETTRFLTDVTTAAGLLGHGRRDKGLAQRIGDFAHKYRMLAAAPERDPELVRDAERYRYLRNDCAGIDIAVAELDDDGHESWVHGYPPDELDAAIDAAIAAEKGGAP